MLCASLSPNHVHTRARSTDCRYPVSGPWVGGHVSVPKAPCGWDGMFDGLSNAENGYGGFLLYVDI